MRENEYLSAIVRAGWRYQMAKTETMEGGGIYLEMERIREWWY